MNSEDRLYDAFLLLKDREEVKSFLLDLCTPQEIEAMAERLLIARMLYGEKPSYREISHMTGASTTTVGRVARFLMNEKHGGYRLVLEQMKIEKDKNNENDNKKAGKDRPAKKRKIG